MEKVDIRIKRITADFDDVELPGYVTHGSAGMDIRAALNETMAVAPQQIVMVPTNLSVEIPEGYEIQVRARSGLAAKHGIAILNAPGTIDSDYRGEVKIILINLGKEEFHINRGDRIAQLILSKVYRAELQITDDLKETKRGEGGFGHTGKS